MAVLTIGRAFDGIDVYPAELSWSGESLTITGNVLIPTGTSNADDVLAATRDRVAALVGNEDEEVVPVTYSVDSTIDGYYRVESAQIGYPLHTQVTNGAPFQVQLTRFGGGSMPQVELYTVQGARANSHSITTTTLSGSTDYYRQHVPAASVDFWCGVQSTSVATRVTASGGLTSWTTMGLPSSFVSSYTVAPGDYYDGACEIRTAYGSATSQLVTGRFAPRSFDGMILSNGLVRAFLHPSVDTAFELEVYDGSQWENLASGVGWRIEHDYGGGSSHSWDLSTASVQILVNRPERCTIRLVMAEAATVAQFGRVWIDLTVRRGETHVGGTVRSDTMGSLGGVVALEPTSSVAATALTGGVRASTTDLPEGNRAVWAIANGTPSLTGASGRLVQTTGNSITPFMVGFELGGSSSTDINNAQDILYQWYNTKTETQRVVLR